MEYWMWATPWMESLLRTEASELGETDRVKIMALEKLYARSDKHSKNTHKTIDGMGGRNMLNFVQDFEIQKKNPIQP